MNVFALTLKDNQLQLPFNRFEVRLKGNDYTKQIGPVEKHGRYFGFRYVFRVFLVVFFGTLTYLWPSTLGSSFILVLLRRTSFLTTFYSLYFNQGAHIFYILTYLIFKVRYKVRVMVYNVLSPMY